MLTTCLRTKCWWRGYPTTCASLLDTKHWWCSLAARGGGVAERWTVLPSSTFHAAAEGRDRFHAAHWAQLREEMVGTEASATCKCSYNHLHKETKIGQIGPSKKERKPNIEHQRCTEEEIVQSLIKSWANHIDHWHASPAGQRAKSTGFNIDQLPPFHQ